MREKNDCFLFVAMNLTNFKCSIEKKWNHIPLNMGRFLSYFIIFTVLIFFNSIQQRKQQYKLRDFSKKIIWFAISGIKWNLTIVLKYIYIRSKVSYSRKASYQCHISFLPPCIISVAVFFTNDHLFSAFSLPVVLLASPLYSSSFKFPGYTMLRQQY